MGTKRVMAPPTSTETDSIAKLRSQYGCGPIEFAGTDNALYERHLVLDNVVGRLPAHVSVLRLSPAPCGISCRSDG
jgi:hypothetical protein